MIVLHLKRYPGSNKGEELAHGFGKRYFEQATPLADRASDNSAPTHPLCRPERTLMGDSVLVVVVMGIIVVSSQVMSFMPINPSSH